MFTANYPFHCRNQDLAEIWTRRLAASSHQPPPRRDRTTSRCFSDVTLDQNLIEGRSFFTTDSQSVSQYVLVSSTLVGLANVAGMLLSQIRGLVSVGHPLGRICNLQCNHSMIGVAQNP
jgi:hypothetical protein